MIDYYLIRERGRKKGGYGGIVKRFGIPDKSMVRKWVCQYKELGYEGLERRKKKQEYSMNFKLDALNYYYQSGLGILEVAVKFNIPSPNKILAWKKEFDTHDIDGLKPKPKGRPVLQEPRAVKSRYALPLDSPRTLKGFGNQAGGGRILSNKKRSRIYYSDKV